MFTAYLYDESGEKVLYGQNTVYINNLGGYGGKRKSSVSKEPKSPPKRKPDATICEKTSIDQVTRQSEQLTRRLIRSDTETVACSVMICVCSR